MYILLFLFSCLFAEQVSYFVPPENWEIAQPKHVSAYVQVGFVGQGSTDFRPSINLAIEEVENPLKEYLKAVKKIHLAQANTQWRDLGKFPMAGGQGQLTEITSPSPWGEIKMLQAILIKDHIAYILTGAVLKQDFPKLQNEILKSFKTLAIAPDLWTPIQDSAKRQEVQKAFASLGKFLPEADLDAERERQWGLVQKIASDHVAEMGSHWQYLFLKEGHAKVYSAK